MSYVLFIYIGILASVQLKRSVHRSDVNLILLTRDSSAQRHFGTVQMGPKCRDISAPVPKCPKV